MFFFVAGVLPSRAGSGTPIGAPHVGRRTATGGNQPIRTSPAAVADAQMSVLRIEAMRRSIINQRGRLPSMFNSSDHGDLTHGPSMRESVPWPEETGYRG